MQTTWVAERAFPCSRTTVKLLLFAILAGVTLSTTGRAQAQASASGAVYFRKKVFQIPIQVEPDKVDLIKELYLFVSTDRGRNWQKIQTATPADKAFTFQAQVDGEYWFTLAYMDKAGNVEPRDVSTEPPGLKLIIDTTGPSIAVKSLPSDPRRVTWEINDDQVNLDSLQVEVKAENGSWQPVAVRKSTAGMAQLPISADDSYTVRFKVKDQAGNEAVQELTHTAASVAKQDDSPRQLDIEGKEFQMPSRPSFSKDRAPAMAEAAPAPPAVQTIPATAPEQSPQVAQRPVQNWKQPSQVVPERPAPRGPARREIHEERWMNAVAQQPHHQGREPWSGYASPIPIASSNQQAIQRTTASKPASPTPMPKPHLSSSRRIEVNYAVRNVGPAGIGKVELYYTQDNGQTWKLYGLDADRTPPFEVELPAEGRYGLQVVVTNPAGYGQRAPRSGDAPQLVIEVDSTAPLAELYQPVPDTRSGQGRLLLRWSASDKHLTDQPVSLFFAVEPNGQLYEIQKNLPAEGSYSWEVPDNIPYQVYLVLLAEDLATNISRAVTHEPVVVDLSQPEAAVIGVVALPDENPTR